ncbi:uncharacterized protein J8A68_005233 [[Candida] subhashii]|uniref:CAP-Gly domain-containing protein n=1 Tax=[Candida] subhashii TaxID=561895 RepID=A0A8J5QHH6_9ASCO|nr:uncharacterized protein J8A68_005233 [[Candida] subhashii]KAG7661237.1 hypothetical protein J8A68_005233 [[Candida] subhashii]
MSDLIGRQVVVPGTTGYGIIRYYGIIQGKTGMFAGVELPGSLIASRGKNSGDVAGVQYFDVRIPKSGLFLPYDRLKAVNPDLPERNQISRRSISMNNLSSVLRSTSEKRQSSYQKPRVSSLTEKTGSPQTNSRTQSPGLPGYKVQSPRTSDVFVSPRTNRSNGGFQSPNRMSNDRNGLYQTGGNSSLDLITKYETEIHDLKRVLRDKEKRLDQFNQQRAEWRAAMDELVSVQQDGMQVYESKIEELMDENKRQEDEIIKLRTTLSQAQSISHNDELQIENEHLKRQLEESTEKIKQLEKEVADGLSVGIQGVSIDNSDLNKEVEELKKELQARPHLNELLELQHSLDELDGMYKHTIQSKDTLINELQEEIKQLKENQGPLSADTAATSVSPASGAIYSSPGLPIYHAPGAIDPSSGKNDWCGLCEREGHTSINCPYENDIF